MACRERRRQRKGSRKQRKGSMGQRDRCQALALPQQIGNRGSNFCTHALGTLLLVDTCGPVLRDQGDQPH